MRHVGDLKSPDPGLGRPGHPGPDPGRLKGSHGQERRGGLAIRAGDPDDIQIVAGVAVPPGRCGGEGGRCGAHDQLRQVHVLDRPFHERDRGAAPGRGFGEVVPVDVQPRDRDEQTTRSDRP